MTPPKPESARRFVGTIVLAAIVGAGVLGYAVMRPRASAITVDPTIPAGTAEGHLLGDPLAPVQVMEFGDFECPHCGDWSTITEPDIRERFIKTGIVAFRYFDVPLSGFKHSYTAHLAASCAEEQGKFWEMHDKLYATQPTWREDVTNDPMSVFRKFATGFGIDVAKWEDCVVKQKPAARIKGNREEGMRLKIQGTPTFVIGDKMIGAVNFDQFKALVDTALAAAKKTAPPGKK